GSCGLGVFVRDAVVANVRVGHADDLPGVGGVREHLLVAGHRRVENGFAEDVSRCTKCTAREYGTVFKCQSCDHAVAAALAGSLRARNVNSYHLTRAVPHANPAPKPLNTVNCPGLSKPCSIASSIASGMEPAEVLPYLSRLANTFERGI